MNNHKPLSDKLRDQFYNDEIELMIIEKSRMKFSTYDKWLSLSDLKTSLKRIIERIKSPKHTTKNEIAEDGSRFIFISYKELDEIIKQEMGDGLI